MANEDIRPSNSEIAESRSNVYRLLAVLYMKEVTPEVLEALKSKQVAEAFEELCSDLWRFLHDPEPEKVLNNLAEEYAALFIVPGGIPPYESVRLKGQLSQEPAWQVEEFYRKCGLVVRDDLRILPDHFGMELEFMGYLAGREADESVKDHQAEASGWRGFQSEFFRDHIEKWAFGFLRDLERYAFHPFYRGLGSLTLRFLEEEKEHLTGHFSIPILDDSES
jgi:TorA maturation chaperone TorD